MSELAARAELLRGLHVPGDPLVVVNVWDAASARTVAAQPSCRALATASWSIAGSYGVRDGQLAPEVMLAAVGRIARAVDLPVSADLEDGYGDAGATMAAAIAEGVVGANLEDRLRPVDEHAERVAAARKAGERAGVPVVVNARTDVFLLGDGDVDEALARGRAYLEAGADCVFAPGLHDLDTVRALAAGLGGPLSLLATPASPPLADLAAARVARVSFGPGPFGAVHATLARLAADLLAGGPYPPDLAHRPSVAG